MPPTIKWMASTASPLSYLADIHDSFCHYVPYSGFFRGVKFSRIDLVQIFEGKNFTNHSTGATVIIIIIIMREITSVKFSQAGMVELYEVESVVQGYYIYKEIWSAAVGSTLPCLQERFNTHDSQYTIGFTALLTASIHDNSTELANDLLELSKIALSHVSNI